MVQVSWTTADPSLLFLLNLVEQIQCTFAVLGRFDAQCGPKRTEKTLFESFSPGTLKDSPLSSPFFFSQRGS